LTLCKNFISNIYALLWPLFVRTRFISNCCNVSNKKNYCHKLKWVDEGYGTYLLQSLSLPEDGSDCPNIVMLWEKCSFMVLRLLFTRFILGFAKWKFVRFHKISYSADIKHLIPLLLVYIKSMHRRLDYFIWKIISQDMTLKFVCC
jgi:hypothetical protein